MKLGLFSLSLNVKDINASKEFYEKIGFSVIEGVLEQKWLIMQNEDVTIGLFEGTIQLLQDREDQNTMTFNPGWDRNEQRESNFTDVRDLRKHFKNKGIEILRTIEPAKEGPASFVIEDPDGNPIFFDQHV